MRDLSELENLLSELKLSENFAKPLTELTRERQQWAQKVNYRSVTQDLEKFVERPFGAESLNFADGVVQIGKEEERTSTERKQVFQMAEKLIPWKKGPFSLFGEKIDAEWRSDLKWDRIKEHIPSLEGKTVLDVGCNNGYFMFRLLEKNPKLVLGIDPVVPNWAQFHFLNHLVDDPRLHFQLWGVENVKWMPQTYDYIFSMGIIYHHRNPMQQLLELKRALKPGGEIILETIGIPGQESYALFPEDRYAKMRNVWFVPTTSCFLNWIVRAKFKEIELIKVSELTPNEQRLTNWCPPPRESLEDFLDPHEREKTIEGYPAPIRIAVKAKRHPDDKQDGLE